MPETQNSNNKKTVSKHSIFKSRKFKYGSAAIGLTAAFIAVIVAINVMFSALATNFKWYIDMTTEGLYTISDSVHETGLSDERPRRCESKNYFLYYRGRT